MNPFHMDVPPPDNTIDSELEKILIEMSVDIIDPLASDLEPTQEAIRKITNLIAKEANKTQADILIWATGGIKEFTEEGKIAIPAKIKELLSLTADEESKQ